MTGNLTPYVARDADHVDRIAQRFGVSVDDIRNEPRNADLVKRRGDLCILCAGDLLYVPAPAPRSTDLAVGTTNSFVASVASLQICINFVDSSGPIAGAEYTIEGLEGSVSGVTDDDGQVKFNAPVTTETVLLTLSRTLQTFEVRIGGLDPIDELSGVRMRLAHLGLYAVDLDDETVTANDGNLQRAVMAFQIAHGLELTGEICDIRSRLRDIHGC